jgi:hypothetical protein
MSIMQEFNSPSSGSTLIVALLKNILSVAYVEEQGGFFRVDHEYLQYIHINIYVVAH